MAIRRVCRPHTREHYAPCSQVTRNPPPNPCPHARPLVSALPPTLARSTLILHRVGLLPREPGYAPHVYAASQLLQHRREWVTARRTGRHQQQPDSQELLRRRTRSRPNPAEGLASHSCEAGLSQGHPHIAGYHTPTCQQLPTPQSTPRSSSTPFRRDGLGSHTSLGGG